MPLLQTALGSLAIGGAFQLPKIIQAFLAQGQMSDQLDIKTESARKTRDLMKQLYQQEKQSGRETTERLSRQRRQDRMAALEMAKLQAMLQGSANRQQMANQVLQSILSSNTALAQNSRPRPLPPMSMLSLLR